MPAFLNWLLRLIVTNPICMRIVQGGSRRTRHLYIRSGYLAVMMVVLLFAMLNVGPGALSVRELAKSGAQTFTLISYLQVGLICLLTPVFMAGAIAQEANPKTWDIILTTPLNSLQIVLGNLFGRLFFVLALLFSTLPLFVVTQYFGGVPGNSIFASYAIAGTSALLVAAIAVTLSVTRTAGKRAVMLFYVSVVLYLFITFALDAALQKPVTTGSRTYTTTVLTPLNPFLALNVLLRSNVYVPHSLTESSAGWLRLLWMSRPITAFCWLAFGVSLVLIIFSTARLRVIGMRTGFVPWYRRLFGLAAKGATERPSRKVGRNAIAWRESTARGKTMAAILARWGFVAVGVLVGVAIITMYHTGLLSNNDMRLAIGTVIGAEIAIILLTALNMSATAVSREREDGTLDIILTTPIQPGPYLSGKLRGLIQYLLPMILVPTVTMIMVSAYVLTGGFGREGGIIVQENLGQQSTVPLPVILPEGAVVLPLMLIPFVAFCVMIGLHWSIKSKGQISSMVYAVGVVLVVLAILSPCAFTMGSSIPVVGAVVSTFNPINMLYALVNPAEAIRQSLTSNVGAARIALLVGSAIAAVVFGAIVFGMHTNMKRTFMMTVRRLAGTN